MRIGQRIKTEKIGTLSYGAGIISLAPSILNIGGLQVDTDALSRTITSDVTLTANSLYMIYVALSSGVPVMRISSNYNSIGPAGFTSWKLVGAFIADGMSSPAFGSFINIEGAPQSTVVPFQGSGSWSNTIYTSRMKMVGDKAEINMTLQFTGVPASGVLAVNTPPNLTMDINKLSSTTGFNYDSNLTGRAKMIVGSAYNGSVLRNSNTSFVLSYLDVNANEGFVTPTTPAAFSSGSHYIHVETTLPIVGWSNTPIKDR